MIAHRRAKEVAPTALFERDRAGNLVMHMPSPRRMLGNLIRRSINWSLDEWDRWIDVTSFGRPTNSGTSVNEHTSLQVSAVYACVDVYVKDIGHLPYHVFERLQPRGRKRAPDNRLDRVIGRRANNEMTAMALWQTMVGHLVLWGNAYAEIIRDGGGRVAELWPLRPDKMTPYRDADKTLEYKYELPNGQPHYFKRREIFHIAGWGFDGIRGYSPIAMAREAIGMAKAMEQFGAQYFGNGAHPGGIVEYPGKLSDKGLENYRRSVQEAYGGLGKSHRLMVLEQGLKYHQVGVPPEDSQFLQTRNYQAADIARFFHVRPEKIGASAGDSLTYSNREEANISHVTDTLMPVLVLIEQAVDMQLLNDDTDRYYSRHNVAALLRGKTLERYQAHAVGRQWGWLSANDVREIEDMNPIDGGDEYLVPLNMVPAGQSGSDRSMRLARYIAGVDNEGQPQKPDAGGRTLPVGGDDPEAAELRTQRSAASRRRVSNSYRRVISEAVARIIRRERADIMREAEKQLRRRSVQELRDFIVRFYGEHRTYISEAMLPAMLAEAEAIQAEAAEEVGADVGMTPEMEDFVRAYLTAYIARHVGSSQGQLLQVIGEAEQAQADVVEAMGTRFDEWQETRPAKAAEWETNQLANAVAKAVFVAAGITRLRWLAWGRNCPYCDSLNGRVVGISEWFLPQGGLLQPEGADVPMTAPRTNVGHPPLHSGCDCAVVAETGFRQQRPVASERRAIFAAIIQECDDAKGGLRHG